MIVCQLDLLSKGPGNNEISIYQHERWFFGNTTSPAAAQFAVLKVAEATQSLHPVGYEIIQTRRYMVDDTVCSNQSLDEAVVAGREALEIYGKTGMCCQKYISNSEELMLSIPLEQRLKAIRKDRYQALPERDILSISVPKDFENLPTTKRELLHILASVYAPNWICKSICSEK